MSMELSVPPQLTAPFGAYPNLLSITPSDRACFCHAVVRFPPTPPPRVEDFSRPDRNQTIRHLATEEERQEARSWAGATTEGTARRKDRRDVPFSIGRYDEDRRHMYMSELFHDHSGSNRSNDENVHPNARTLHVGIDLSGPVGTPVYACCDGVVHAAGYNAPLGDYGYVLVVRHWFETTNHIHNGKRVVQFYALYGHLDATVETRPWRPGDAIQGGQKLACMGDVHENGGWLVPHVHFQVSLHPPATHDMPGVVKLEDREKALLEYLDPRYVLGEIY